MDKASLRRHLRMRLYALGEDELRQKSALICQNIIATTDWQTITRVSCYRSQLLLREVDTSAIVDYVHTNWPSTTLDLVEPNPEAAVPNTQYDLIIVPVLGFDANCNRLGRGGGWYDRFLSTQDTARKIGLAFDCQAIESIPIEDFDVELDDIITES